MNKVCVKCNQVKALDAFRRDGRSPIARVPACIKCSPGRNSRKEKGSASSLYAEPRAGFVYFIEADNGLTKIGKTGDLQQRFTALKTSSPCEIRLVHSIATDDMNVTEYNLHRLFESKRVRGEWFKLTPDDLIFPYQFTT